MRCPTGSQFDGSQCSLVKVTPEPTPCGSNQVRVNNECVCNDGLHLINNECLACPRYTTWNGKFCQCGCDPQAWCLGEPFSAWDSENKICNCQSGYTRVNGICMML